jgi:8-oxo-dGTP pyrophosphatase MutT (NUDIX family)
MEAYELLHAATLPFSAVKVIVEDRFSRVPHPTHEAMIEDRWAEACKKNAKIFNGTKFRFSSVSAERGVMLCLGLTDYKSFMGTNLCDEWASLLQESAVEKTASKMCNDSACFLACPLGNGAVVETSDGKVLLLKRSDNVGECPGMVVFPGGHPEPSVTKNEDYVHELADSILREITEETGAAKETLSEPLLIGFCARVQNHRPAYFCFVKCSLTSAEMKRNYDAGNVVDRYESNELLVVAREDLEHELGKVQMPGCHRGGFELYKMHLQREEMAAAGAEATSTTVHDPQAAEAGGAGTTAANGAGTQKAGKYGGMGGMGGKAAAGRQALLQKKLGGKAEQQRFDSGDYFLAKGKEQADVVGAGAAKAEAEGQSSESTRQ